MSDLSLASDRHQPLSRLKNSVPAVLAKSFSPIEVKKLRDIFARYDEERDGQLTRVQVGKALKSLSPDKSEHEIGHIIDAALIGRFPSANVTFDTFCHMMYNTKALHRTTSPTISPAVLRYKDGSSFRGQATEYGIFHGKGNYQVGHDGAAYTGMFSQGRFHGRGTIWYPDSSAFEGQFVNGVRTGEGTISFPDGSKYTGHFQMGLFDGYGEYECGSGDVYKGMFKEGRKEGEGKMFYRDGSTFEGTWYNDHRRPGFGTLEWDNGDLYSGDFAQNGLYHGQGKLRRAQSGDVYEGAFDNGRKHGVGRMEYGSTGDSYKGDWFKGTKTGFGIYIFADGNTYEGEWVNDRMEGMGEYNFNTGDKYVGQFLLDHPHGEGTATYSNGATYIGTFREGLPFGRGTMVSSESESVCGQTQVTSSWTGLWRSGKRLHGTGEEEAPQAPDHSSTIEDDLRAPSPQRSLTEKEGQCTKVALESIEDAEGKLKALEAAASEADALEKEARIAAEELGASCP